MTIAPSPSPRELTCAEAFNESLAQIMHDDPSVFVGGQSLSAGGGFGAFAGLRERYGAKRVVDLPISEQAIVGLGVGSAMSGLRPVIDLMYMDFMLIAMDQIVNQAAKLAYRLPGASVPLTITTTVGSGSSRAAVHSQSLEAMLAHFPGLKVVMASNAHDTKGLLAASIRDDDPVVFMSHARLLDRPSPCPQSPVDVPIGAASTIRPGSDVTLVTYGAMVPECLRAASVLSATGVDVEIIDLRTLVPVDFDTVLASVRRTLHCVIVHEAVRFGGLGAEIAAHVQEHGFDYLDAPVKRIAGPSTPVPFSPSLESAWLPDSAEIVAQVRAIVS